MSNFQVSIPDNKTSFFIEFLQLIGASYESCDVDFKLSASQKKFLIDQNKVPLEDCTSALDLYNSLTQKYEL